MSNLRFNDAQRKFIETKFKAFNPWAANLSVEEIENLLNYHISKTETKFSKFLRRDKKGVI